MKKSLLLFIAGSVLLSCNESPAPKQVAQKFIESIHANNFTAAAALVTTETKAVVNQQKPRTSSTTTAEECFSLSTLSETINNNTAEVKNENISLSLKKEQDGWKVSADEKTIDAIYNRESNIAVVKEAWKKLLQEYQTRIQVAKEYVRFSVATNETYRNAQGEKITDTQWHNLVAFCKVADIAEKYLDKGSEVALEGKLVNRNFTDKEGVKKYVTEIHVSELLLLGANSSKAAAEV